MKIQFGCGKNKLPGWHNCDAEIDIRRPLPFGDDSADFVFTEHVVEHIGSPDAMRFFLECHRILKPGGVVRTAVPDVERFYLRATDVHIRMQHGFGADSEDREAATRLIVFGYGHQSCWTEGLLDTMLRLAHFATIRCSVGKSQHPELCGLEGRGVLAGDSGINEAQTAVVEGMKLRPRGAGMRGTQGTGGA